MSDELEHEWNEEYKNFMISFYPESSPLVSTWEIYKTAKRKSHSKIKELSELAEILNQIRDNLQDENKKLQEQNKIMREALEYYSDDGGRDEEDISNVQKCIMGMIVVIAKGGKRAREALKKAD